MSRLFAKADLKTLSSVVAVVLLLSSIPLSSGVVIVSGPSHPEFTVNICQRTQAFNCASQTLLARPAVNAPEFVLLPSTSLTVKPTGQTVARDVPPDTPPPERLA